MCGTVFEEREGANDVTYRVGMEQMADNIFKRLEFRFVSTLKSNMRQTLSGRTLLIPFCFTHTCRPENESKLLNFSCAVIAGLCGSVPEE